MAAERLWAEAEERAKRRDPLDHWLEQEQARGLEDFVLPDPEADDREPGAMASGWWLLPVMVMALPVWGLLIWMIAAA